MAETDFDRIKKQVRQFVVERDWDQFHSPKNLSMALIVEAAEMVEHFQWLTEEQSCNLSPEKLAEVELELADIQVYLISLAEKLQAGSDRRGRQEAGTERRRNTRRTKSGAVPKNIRNTRIGTEAMVLPRVG